MAGAADDDSLKGDEVVLALLLVFAEVDGLELSEEVGSMATGVVAPPAAPSLTVFEDLVLLLQPPRANPAEARVIKMEFFMGMIRGEKFIGLSFPV